MDINLQKTLDAIKASYANPLAGDLLSKATFSQAGSAISGLTYYDLEPGAKLLYPVLTPLRNDIPRVSGKGGIQANWRAITAINTSGIRLGVSGGNRGGVMAVASQDYLAAYKGIGLESSVDFEAQYAALGFDDARGLAAKTLLEATMIGEEAMILGGNGSYAIGQGGTPTAVAATSGGFLPDATYSVIVVPLTLDGFINGSVVGGIQGQITRTNADQSTDTFGGGAGKQSVAASAVVTGGGGFGKVTASTAVVVGAAGYAWFLGVAGSEKLAAITALNSVILTAVAAGTQTALSLGTNDNSVNGLSFDGLLTIAQKPGLGGYNVALPTGTAGVGTPLTSDNSGGIVEIDAALKYFWDVLRLSPTEIWVHSQEALNISKKLLQGSQSAPASRITFTRNIDDGMIAGAVMVQSYLNRFSMTGGQVIPIKLHPNMPAGTILFVTRTLPYPIANVGNVIQIRTRQEYYQIEWPLRSRKYELGVYADEVLQHFFPPSMGVITNIANG